MLEELYAYIESHKDDIIKELMELSSIKSVSDATSDVKPFGQGCKDVLDAALAKGAANGFKTHNYEYYAGSILFDAGKKENIGILAHLDVVPEGEGWTVTEPYSPKIQDGFLFGRGVGDNKSAAIAALYIAKAFKEYNVPLNHNIEILLGTNEEKGMADMEYYASKYPTPKFTFVPDAGFPGSAGEFGRLRYILTTNKALSDEFVDMYAGTVFNIIPNKATVVLKKDTTLNYKQLPQDFEIKETEKGIEITAFGLSSHAAGPERGINAIKVLTNGLVTLNLNENDKAVLEFINNVNQDCYGTFLGIDKEDEVSGQTVSSGTVLRFNEGHLSLTNDCRYCVTDNGDRLYEAIKAKCDTLDVSVQVEEKTYPSHLDPSGTIIQTIKKVFEDYTGEQKDIRIGKGGTYAGKLPNAFATGAVLRGNLEVPSYIQPGHGGAHQQDEFIPIDGYIEGIKLLMTMILKVDEIL